MRAHGSFFDHNLHALRIVEDFELRYAAFRGLNLTFEVREGIIKHSHDYSVEQFPELGEYLLDQRPPLEAQLIDLADEIAYDTADLDDGYEARLLTLPQIRDGVPAFDEFYADAERAYPNVVEKFSPQCPETDASLRSHGWRFNLQPAEPDQGRRHPPPG